MFAVPLFELDGFACTLTKVIQFGTSDLAAANGFDIEYIGGMDREYSLHAFVVDNPTNGKGFIHAASPTGDDRTCEYLGADLVALFDAAMDIHDITYLEMRSIFLKRLALDSFKQFRFHSSISC